MSGNHYPIGMPNFVLGEEIREHIENPDHYTFLRFRCRFKIKENHLPFIQIKGNPFYKGTEMLEDSRPTWKGKKYYKLIDKNEGEISDKVEMTMTETDFRLMLSQYYVSDLEILDGCWFYTDIGMFDEYINYWMEIKKNSPSGSARRTIAKLFLNNLYGKFSTSPINITREPTFDGEKVSLPCRVKKDKKPVYIPIGAAITSYARNFTIRAAQANFDNFCYADTDSIHCLCSMEDIKGIKVHPTNFCCWKLESCWDEAIFVRQKTYIEHATHEDGKAVESYYNVKAAGMPKRCKNYFIKSMTETKEEADYYSERYDSLKWISEADKETSTDYQEAKFLKDRRTLKDFKVGLEVPGKLRPVRIPGGIVLMDEFFTIRDKPIIS